MPYKYFPNDPFKFFLEILPKYSTDICPNIFLLRNILRIILKSLLIFHMVTRVYIYIYIYMHPVSYNELYNLISLVHGKYMLISK
jgi:hypothetical protein